MQLGKCIVNKLKLAKHVISIHFKTCALQKAIHLTSRKLMYEKLVDPL